MMTPLEKLLKVHINNTEIKYIEARIDDHRRFNTQLSNKLAEVSKVLNIDLQINQFNEEYPNSHMKLCFTFTGNIDVIQNEYNICLDHIKIVSGKIDELREHKHELEIENRRLKSSIGKSKFKWR